MSIGPAMKSAHFYMLFLLPYVHVSQPLEGHQEHGSKSVDAPEGLSFVWRITFIRNRSECRAKINVRESLALCGVQGSNF